MVQTHGELDMSMLGERGAALQVGQGTQTVQGTQSAQTIEEENLEAA